MPQPHESRGRILFVDPEDITKDLPEIAHRSAKGRPGVFQKPLNHWEWESQAPEHKQGGQGGLFYAVYEEDGRLDGYVKYRTARPNLIVQELMAVTPGGRQGVVAALLRLGPDDQRRGAQPSRG